MCEMLHVAVNMFLSPSSNEFRVSKLSCVMADIESPENVNDAVKMLPASQHPYTSDCAISRDIQSILFHYDVSYQATQVLIYNDFTRRKVIKRADPEGDDEQRGLFRTLAEQVNPLQRVLLRDAFVRILSDHPMAAVVAPPPKKRSKLSLVKSSAASAGAGAAPVAPAAPAARARLRKIDRRRTERTRRAIFSATTEFPKTPAS